MIYGGITDEVRLESDEFGWELVVETDLDSYRFNVHGVIQDIIKCGVELQAYLDEGRRLASEHQRGLIEIGTIDADGYHPLDPKHPDYHDLMSEISDAG